MPTTRFLTVALGLRCTTIALACDCVLILFRQLYKNIIINLKKLNIMRKIFLFLFAAVLSIGTAMAQTTHNFYAEGVTVSEGEYSIDLSRSVSFQ